MTGKRLVQMKDVAERAQVSITTVSHVLNNTRPVAPDTEHRVREALRELRYFKNISARLMVRGQSDSYGLIISDIENPFFPRLIKSFEQAADERGFDVLLSTSAYRSGREQKAVRRMIENKVRGVAVMTSQLDEEAVNDLLANDIPVVRLDAGPVRRGRSNIRVDYSVGALSAARHLHELGHDRVAFLTGPQNRLSAVTYRKAILDGLTRFGLCAAPILDGTNRLDNGVDCARILAASGELPTALICGNDLAAIGAMRTFQEAGFRIPQDISIIGGDDIDVAGHSYPPLSTIRVPRDKLGRMAFEALERILRTKVRKAAEYVLETEFVVRGSTGPARGESGRGGPGRF